MRTIRISLFDLVQEVVETNSVQKNQLIRKSELIRFLLFSFNDILNFVNWDQKEYRKKLRFIFENKYFKNWKSEKINSFETNLTTIIKEIKVKTFHLLSLFRFMTTAVDQRVDRRNMKNRWIFVIFILCFIYKSRTCVRWSIMWDIQLHVNDTKRRVIENLSHWFNDWI